MTGWRPAPMAGLRTGVAAAALALMTWVGAGEAGQLTLGSAAAESGRYLGAAIDPDALDERPYRDLAATQLTSVTPENAMKWESIEPLRGEYDWARADALVAFAKAHGQKVRGHTLVWHTQLPLWLIDGAFSPDELRSLMVAHIAAEAGRYRGAIYAWDVVNEPFTDDGNWRNSIWREAMGPDYVAIALKAARAADPDAKLYVNDYNVESAGPKMRALYDLVASLKRNGVPIDGVGLQSHFVAGKTPADFGAVVQKFAARRRRRGNGARPPHPPACGRQGAGRASRRLRLRRPGVPRDAALRRRHHLGNHGRPLVGSVILFRLWRGAAVR